MKRVALSMVLAAGLATSSAMAADMATKAPPAPPPPPSPWDVAITAALMTDYNFRGVTQSAHHPSSQAGFELRYNQTASMQWYAGISGESIDFPNQAAAEIDFYGGFRPTFDKLALDFGVWEYWYPGGKCWGNAAGTAAAAGGVGVCTAPENGPASTVPNNNGQPLGGNVVKSNVSFIEFYAKATYTFNDQWSAGAQYYYSPSVLNSGAPGNYIAGTITFTEPSSWWGSTGIGGYVSADLGYWGIGKSDAFYGTGVVGSPQQFGVNYTDYWNWDAGLGFTYKAFTLDLRYYDSSLNKAECSVFTSASNTSFATSNITQQNPTGLGSNWCSAAYIAKLTFATNLSSIK